MSSNQIDVAVNRKLSGVSSGLCGSSMTGRVFVGGFITTIGGGSGFITGGVPTTGMVAVT